MQNKAREYYATRQGNCAQAVVAAFGGAQTQIEEYAGCGGGRAPEGVCGALHAARALVPEGRRDLLDERFRALSGGEIHCRPLRKANTFKCLDCVGAAASLLEELEHRR